MKLHPDWREFIELLNSHKVEYVIVGAWARSFHGIPRTTGDIDFFVRSSAENAARLIQVLEKFGFASMQLSAKDFMEPGQIVQLRFEPYRIDVITGISGVTFEEAWSERVAADVDGVPVAFLSLRLFKQNKQASGRPKDLADLDALGE
jgi:hypothetical protein